MEPFFDFIVMIGNVRLDRDDERLKDILKANVEKPIKLLVFSSKTMTVDSSKATFVYSLVFRFAK